MESPNVQTSTTSPVVAAPRCHRTITQARNRNCGVGDSQLFEITEAASSRRQFPVDGGVKSVVLEAEAAKRPHQRHVVDDIDHLAVDGGGFVGEIVVQRLAGGSQMKHRKYHRAGDDDQSSRHQRTHGADQRNCRDSRDAWRQHVPDEHIFNGEDGIGCGRNAAGQHSRQPVGEIAWCMPGQVAEDVATQIPGHAHECETRRPAGDPPQKIIRCYQRHEQNECQPYTARAGRPG